MRLCGVNFKSTLFGTQIICSFSPKLFIKPFIQWNRNSLNTNVLFNFIHSPESDPYIVYNEELEKVGHKFSSNNRALLLKFTYLISF